MATTYAFPPDNGRMRAVSLVPYGASGLLIPKWTKGSIVWKWSGVAMSSAALTSASIGGLLSSCGFAAAVSDGASGAWAVQYTGSLVSYSSGGAASGHTLPAGQAYTGCAYASAYAQPYVASANGMLYAGSGAVPLNANGFNTPTWGLAVSGSTLFALASGGLATFALSSATIGVNGFIAYPNASLQVGHCLAASAAASAVAVGGWGYYSFASGYTSMAFASGSALMVALSSGSGVIDLYLGPNEVWARSQSITGAGAPSAAAWTPDGTKVLVTDPVSGTVRSYTYSLGTLSLAQTLSVSGAFAVAVTPDGITALVCQQSAGLVTPLTLSGSVWVTGAPMALATPSSVYATTAASGVVGFLNGLAYLNKSGSWSVGSTVPLPFTPTTVLPASGNILATGTSTGSGFLAAVSGSSVLFQYSWPGAAAGMIYDQGQIVVNDNVSPFLWSFGNVFTAYGVVFTTIPNQTFNNIAVSPFTANASGGTIFGMASGATLLHQFTTPYNIEPLRSGSVGLYGPSGWAVVALSSGHVPTAITYDATGGVWVATLQNNLYQIGSGGTILSSATVTQFSGQAQTTPLGISALAFVGSGLYAASSLAGPLVKLF